MLKTVTLFGIPIACASRGEILRAVLAEADAGRQVAVATLNAEMAVEASRNPEFHRLLAERMLVVPDGRRIAVTARKALGAALDVYPGIEFAFDLVKATIVPGGIAAREQSANGDAAMREGSGSHSVFLLGSRPGVAETAAEKIAAEIPGARIAGTHHGFFKGEDGRVVELVNASGATILLAGLGSPFQEFWIEKHRALLSPRILAGVGGSFEVWAGVHRRAPGWIRTAGLEWLYRALADPRRLKRLVFIPAYLALERAEARAAFRKTK